MGADAVGADAVVIHGRLTVFPAKTNPIGKVHKLSYLDHMMRRHYGKLIYYYDTSSVENRPNLIMSLRITLSKAISNFPLFCGRLRKSDDGLWEVTMNDAGLRAYEATCDYPMEKFFAGRKHSLIETELCRHEINDSAIFTPVAVVQFTEFSCGNIAIGLSWHHAIADPMCATLFMKAWGEAHRGARILHPPFFHPPSLGPRPQRSLITQSRNYYTSSFFNKERDLDAKNELYQSVTLNFNHDTVTKLMSEVQNGSYKFGPPLPSDVLCALLWVAVSRAQGKSSCDVAMASLCLEVRKIHRPPLPYGYVGNALHFSKLSFPMDMAEDNDLSRVAGIINECAGMLDSEEVSSVIDLIQDMEDQGKGVLRDPPFFYSDGLTIAIFDHLFCYDDHFQFGRPSRVTCSVQPIKGDGQIIILPAAEGGSSRSATISLPKPVMEKLLNDSQLERLLVEPVIS
ncbi:hypothetical protein KP509_22G053400 [Ceratopteris richardii]|nr:hypothetical protein KP509_22G053400 [Ceratopteris richardii]KAH7307302.1 hypothetical protein KP509_22G053400 [Ceratopteris richardii]